jgi:hypothetical protein
MKQNQTRKAYYKDWDDYCYFQDPKNGFPLMSGEEFNDYVEYMNESQEAEIHAENAWLRKAEQGIDDGFDRWEFERGCY